MGKVISFPQKKQLPKVVEDSLYEIAKAYIYTLIYALTVLSNDTSMAKELDEIRDLINVTYINGLLKAIDEVEQP